MVHADNGHRLSYEERSASVLGDQLVMNLAKHRISANRAFLRIARAWTTMDASLRELAPRRNLRPVIVRFFRSKARRARANVLQTVSNAPGSISLIDIPRSVYEWGIFRGSTVRRLAQVFEGSTTVAAQLVARAFGVLATLHLLAGIAVAGVFLYQHHPTWVPPLATAGWAARVRALPRPDPQVWLLIFFLLVYGWRSSRHLIDDLSAILRIWI
jgi:hypothetical protein